MSVKYLARMEELGVEMRPQDRKLIAEYRAKLAEQERRNNNHDNSNVDGDNSNVDIPNREKSLTESAVNVAGNFAIGYWIGRNL